MDGLLRMFANLFNGSPVQASQPLIAATPANVSSQNPMAQNYPNVPYSDMILRSAKAHGLGAADLAAALDRESGGFDPKYVQGYHMDGTGRGIAGIDSVQHPEIQDAQAMDPSYAIEWMAKQLGDLQQQDGNFYNAYREYNGGPNYASNRIGYGGNTVNYNTAHNADAVAQLAQKYQPIFKGF